MSNDNLPACPVCGEAPRYTLTFAGNHALRCDGPIPGDSPRHTIYVLQPELDAARALWTKAVAQQANAAAEDLARAAEMVASHAVDRVRAAAIMRAALAAFRKAQGGGA